MQQITRGYNDGDTPIAGFPVISIYPLYVSIHGDALRAGWSIRKSQSQIPIMDGLSHGKSQSQIDDLEVPPISGNLHISNVTLGFSCG